MRLKEDRSSYRAESLIKKEFVHTPIEDTGIKHKAKKNTKKWCGGVEGREHDWEMTAPSNSPFRNAIMRKPVCKKCKKQDWRNTEYLCQKCGSWKGGIFCRCEDK